MKIILIKPHTRLGESGDIVAVKDGYARNFLFPRNLAIPATDSNLRQVEVLRRQRVAQEEKRKGKLAIVAEKLSRTSVDLQVEADANDMLYGSVTSGLIADALQKQGFDVDRKKIHIDEPIDRVGVYNVRIELHPEIDAKVRVWVIKHAN